MTKKILAMLLAVLTVMPLAAACSGGTDDKTAADTTASGADAAETTAAVQGEVPRNMTPDDLPDGLNFDGQTIRIGHRNHEHITDYQLIGENNGGDVLFDAVYERNQTVQDRLNVKLDFVVRGNEYDQNSFIIRDQVALDILSGESIYDVLFMSAQFGFTQSLLGYYYDLMDLPYVNIDQPWWWADYMEEQSIDTNKRYLLNGDVTLYALMSATAAYFNKEIFTNLNGDVEQLYTMVEDGTWTFDKFLEYSAAAYSDVNGDGTRDEDDIYGSRNTSIFTACNYSTLSCGLDMHKRNSDGLPELDVYNDNWVKWAEMLAEYTLTDEYTKLAAAGKRTEDYFGAGKSLFSMSMLYDADKLRDTEFEYGIVPFPKFSEQYDYKSAGATPNADAIMIPVTTNPDLFDCIGATLEAMCAETYRNVTETYYETTLKGKYLGAERDIQMVDIIYQNIATNFVMVAGVELGNGAISSIFSYVMRDHKGNFTSYYDSNKVKFEEYMNGMMEKYYALG